jgi:acyl-CoA synthetase (NDP forming)
MARSLARLLNPKSIAIFGGGWATNVIIQLKKSGFAGEIWPVHPKREDILGIKCYRSVEALPAAPDASFIGVNRETSVKIVEQLAKINAGGATCFASGFLESEGKALVARSCKIGW